MLAEKWKIAGIFHKKKNREFGVILNFHLETNVMSDFYSFLGDAKQPEHIEYSADCSTVYP